MTSCSLAAAHFKYFRTLGCSIFVQIEGSDFIVLSFSIILTSYVEYRHKQRQRYRSFDDEDLWDLEVRGRRRRFSDSFP